VAASFVKQDAERQHLVSSFNRTIFEERRILNAVRMNAMVVLDEFPLAGGAGLAGIGVWALLALRNALRGAASGLRVAAAAGRTGLRSSGPPRHTKRL
jgi:hypothetical protein